MRRSEARPYIVVVILALVALLRPFGVEAQRSPKVARVGYLIPSSEPLNVPLRDAFFEGLRELGYVDGGSVTIDARYADGDVERLPRLLSWSRAALT
jgi:putative ABC transport system substrate-binding protein